MSRWILATLVLAVGCNPCQSLCHEMAEAAEACDIQVSDAELESCLDTWKTASSEERSVCHQTAEDIAGEWDCNEIRSYFGASSEDTDAAE